MEGEAKKCGHIGNFLNIKGLVGENNLELERGGCGRIENLKAEIEGIFFYF